MLGQLMDRLREITPEEQRILAGGGVEQALYASGREFTVDSAKLLARGQLITLRPHTRFAAFPTHSHNYVEIMYMCTGSTRHQIDYGLEVELEAGELLFLNQHARHQVEAAGQEDVGVNFIVLPQFFDYALTMTGTENVLARLLLDGLRQGGGDQSCLHFHCGEMRPVQNLVENLLLCLFAPGGGQKIAQATMGLLLMELLGSPQGLSKNTPGYNAGVLAALGEVEDNYRDADLTRVAEELHVSLSYLSSSVKQATGKTFKDLLLEKRLRVAAGLMKSTNLPVEDIIAAVGYDNTSFFYRKFRQYYGVSPREWRKA
ncbi:MAG: AraC family transcriptional regulator [Acutalibacter sp.]|nr:AraC family transcriptional regulator [Acutalibacter sp.]